MKFTPDKTRRDERGLIEALLGDGHFLLALTGVALIGSGGFALFLCLSGHFLPHDVAHLGMDARQLALVSNERLVGFMFHDRAAFGGALISMGSLYLWLVAFPLKHGEAWAWWALAVSGATGFGSFLTYLAYGYLDQWHGVATLCLLPIFIGGMIRSQGALSKPSTFRSLWQIKRFPEEGLAGLIGRRLLLAYGGGLVAAGAVISFTGMTSVFVATDLGYIGLTKPEICGVSEKLVPLIAHDRAGFGGGLISIGLVILALVNHAAATRSFKQVMLLAGGVGFVTAIGVHFLIGYLDPLHLAPAFAGMALFLAGWALVSFAPGARSQARPVGISNLETKKAGAS
jgi:MFS family permease